MFAIPKTASRSSWRTFRPYADIVGVDDEESPYEHHVQPSIVKKNWPEMFDSYFKFCFVRNPWDRMISHYFYDKYNRPFLDFINEHVLMGENCIVCCKEQTGWSKHVDYVARFENYEEEIHNIFNLIGIKKEPIFSHENKTEHKPYTEYYDDKSIMIIYEKYKRDIEIYNYEFGE
jgi:hypothetical protein